jgi:hypothetical protein
VSGKKKLALLALVVVVVVVVMQLMKRPFPSDQTPEGAYLRIAKGLSEDHPEVAFPYLETEAQWACITLRDTRKKTLERVLASYPEAQRADLVRAYEADARAAGGEVVFVRIAKERGWIARLRRDLSGVAKVEVEGERASVVTARGTRYAFRRRDNGIWGLTMFTADLEAEAQKASRDLSVVMAAADDFDRAKNR